MGARDPTPAATNLRIRCGMPADARERAREPAPARNDPRMWRAIRRPERLPNSKPDREMRGAAAAEIGADARHSAERLLRDGAIPG